MRQLLPVAGVWLVSVAPGCAYHATGLVHPALLADGTVACGAEDVRGLAGVGACGSVLSEWDGDARGLVLSGDALWLAALDGHTAEIWGRRAGPHVVVTAFRVHDGLHGLPTWIGPLTMRGVQLGVEDHNTGQWFPLHEDANEQLAPYQGAPVLIEGYQEPDERVRVMYWRPLDPKSGASP